MTPFEFLMSRRSVPSRQLGMPGPDAQEQQALFELAVRVPDHGRLAPWRFIRIAGDSRLRFGSKLAALTQARDSDAPEAVIEKDRTRFSKAPLVVVVVARLTKGHKVPEQEQLLSAGCVCYNLLLGAQAMGYGAQWLTAWPAYDPAVAALLGLGDAERVAGFIHIGTMTADVAHPERPDAAALVTDLA